MLNAYIQRFGYDSRPQKIPFFQLLRLVSGAGTGTWTETVDE